ncbi:MAG: RNA polymerase sigma factor [Terriglobales bacterium]
MSTQDTTVGLNSGVAAWGGEQQLAADLRAGSVDAFNYLISLYHQPIYRFVCRLLGHGDDTADVVQETFLKAFRGAGQFEGKSSAKTWLYQIALHEASNHRRWWRRHKGHETSIEAEDERGGLTWAQRLPDPGASPLSQALQGERKQRLQAALRQVPEPYHAVLMLREIEGFSYDEIAEIVQARVGTVKSRLLRGREMLRQAVLAAEAIAARPASVRGLRSVGHANE